MALFRDENPALGPLTTEKELSGFGAGNPTVSYFKPTTREIISWSQGFGAIANAGFWLFTAPWQCQVIAIRATWTTASSAGTLAVNKFTQGGLPQAPTTATNGTTVVQLQASATLSTATTANTTTLQTSANGGLSAASGSPLVLQAGDQLALNLAGTQTGLAGLYVQVEIAQIG